MALLAVSDLSVRYGATIRAADGVSFGIEPGEVFALVGGSGSGKSSVALALTQLLPSPPAVVSGRVALEGQSLLTAGPELLRAIRGGKISYVFQDPATSLNPVLTVGAQLIETIERHTSTRGLQARRLAGDWLQRVGITGATERLGAYPHEFSGGMRQRVCLAMALASSPKLLIADEPTSALDVTVQVQILRLIRELNRTLRLAMLLISHDLLVVERVAHRVGVMSEGRLVESGTVEQVLRAPRHPYTQELVACRLPFAPTGGSHG